MRWCVIVYCLLCLSIQVTGQVDQTQALSTLHLADSLVAAERFQEAYKQYKKVLPYFEKTEDWYRQAHINLWMGESIYYEGAYEKALAYTLQSKTIAENQFQADTLPFYSLILQNLGVFYASLGDFENQFKYYQQSFQQALTFHGKESEQGADAYFSVGAAFGRRGNWAKCIAYTDTSLQISRAINYQGGIASAYLNLAHAYGVGRNFQKAIDYQKQAIQLAESQEEIARGNNNLGMYYHEVGEEALAQEYLNKSLALRQKIYPSYHDNVISSYLNLARVYYDIGDQKGAMRYTDKAIREMQNPAHSNPAYLKMAYNYKAVAYWKEGALDKAEQYARKAIQAGGSLHMDASTSLVLATVLLAQDRYAEALAEIQTALQLNVRDFTDNEGFSNPKLSAIEDMSIALDLLGKKGEILYYKGLNNQDIESLRAGVAVYQLVDSLVMKSRKTLQDEGTRQLLSADAKELYAYGIRTLFALKKLDAQPGLAELAFAWSEKNKALSLSEKLNNQLATRFSHIPEALVVRERQLLTDIDFYTNNLLDYGDMIGETLRENWEDILFDRRQTRDSLLAAIAVEYPEYYNFRYNFESPSSALVQQQLLQKEELLIEYYYHEDKLHVFLISAKAVDFMELPLEESLVGLVDKFRNSLVNQEKSFYQHSYRLYQVLLAPFEERLSHKKLFIIPDGVIGHLPFEALLQNRVDLVAEVDHRALPYLIRKHNFRYYFSAQTALQSLQRKPFRGNHQIFALAPEINAGTNGNTAQAYSYQGTRGAALSNLKGTEEEVNRLQALLPGKFVSGPTATETLFKSEASKYKVLHIATHTLINDRFPGLSKLVFSAEEEEDGMLQAFELYNMQLQAELVTLSACNTGFGKIKQGEGIASLARAFAYAGCPNTVMSLWQVKDHTTTELMDRFYQNLSAGLDKQEALHQAKLSFLDEYNALFSHPYYWACFVYMGDATPIQLGVFPQSNYLFLLPIVLGALLLVRYFQFRKRKA